MVVAAIVVAYVAGLCTVLLFVAGAKRRPWWEETREDLADIELAPWIIEGSRGIGLADLDEGEPDPDPEAMP